MSEKDFSNREIGLMFNEIKQTLNRVEVTGMETKNQATKTNGRVTALELVNSNRTGANNVIKYILVVFCGILVSYLGWLGLQVTEIKGTLSTYEIIK
jgi:hypothetical protein